MYIEEQAIEKNTVVNVAKSEPTINFNAVRTVMIQDLKIRLN